MHGALGNALAVTQVHHNLGWVAARRGDVPGALRWYDRVEAEYEAHGVPIGLLLLDRCEVLASARLGAEARAAAERGGGELGAERMEADAAEARLLVAQAALLTTTRGRRSGTRSPRAGRSRGRDGAHGPCSPRRPRCVHAGSAASAPPGCCGRRGGPQEARRRRAGRRPRSTPGSWRAAPRCRSAGSRWPTNSSPTPPRPVGGVRSSSGSRPGTRRPCCAPHTATGAPRVPPWSPASGRSTSIARRSAPRAARAGRRPRGRAGPGLGIRLALDRRRARAVLAAAERGRAGALWAPPVRPPDDAVLAAQLVELRGVAREVDQALLEDRDASVHLRRRAELEQAVAHPRAPGARRGDGRPRRSAALTGRSGRGARRSRARRVRVRRRPPVRGRGGRRTLLPARSRTARRGDRSLGGAALRAPATGRAARNAAIARCARGVVRDRGVRRRPRAARTLGRARVRSRPRGGADGRTARGAVVGAAVVPGPARRGRGLGRALAAGRAGTAPGVGRPAHRGAGRRTWATGRDARDRSARRGLPGSHRAHGCAGDGGGHRGSAAERPLRAPRDARSLPRGQPAPVEPRPRRRTAQRVRPRGARARPRSRSCSRRARAAARTSGRATS